MTISIDYVAECYQALCDLADTPVLDQLVAAARRDPEDSVPIYRLAEHCRYAGNEELWRYGLDLAFGLDHSTYEQLHCRAKAKFLLGDWSGWIDHEARLFHPDFGCTTSPLIHALRWTHRLWDGVEDISAHVLLILCQGGFGDVMQMLRFIPGLAHRARQVIVDVQPQLVTLARHILGDSVCVTSLRVFGDVEYKRYAWMMSLPAFSEGLPPFTPITSLKPVWRLGTNPSRQQIGVCWACGDEGPHGVIRTMPFAALSPLWTRDDIEWHSLQVGDRAAEGDSCAHLARPAQAFRTFADTANFVAALDGVVTVDTSVAHLAAGMGKPTYLLLTTGGDSRWGSGNTTPWYPSMQLIRQVRWRDWSTVMSTLMSKLDDQGFVSKHP